MTGSIYEQAAESVFEEGCAEDSRLLTLTAETSQKLRRGYFQKDIVDAFGQYHFSPPLWEIHSFMQLWYHAHGGDIALAKVKIGHCPNKDVDIEGNNGILQEVVCNWDGYFKAEFWGGLGDHDGYIKVLKPLLFDTMNTPQDSIEYGGHNSDSLSLEVGTQSWSKTLHMMRVYGALARWPYGSEYLWLFVMRPEVIDKMQARIMEYLGIPNILTPINPT